MIKGKQVFTNPRLEKPIKEHLEQSQTVKAVLNRALNDSIFWMQLFENCSQALEDYRLSSEAKSAIFSGDVRWVYENVPEISEEEMTFLYKKLECGGVSLVQQ